jgi:hypothetical protein
LVDGLGDDGAGEGGEGKGSDDEVFGPGLGDGHGWGITKGVDVEEEGIVVGRGGDDVVEREETEDTDGEGDGSDETDDVSGEGAGG